MSSKRSLPGIVLRCFRRMCAERGARRRGPRGRGESEVSPPGRQTPRPPSAPRTPGLQTRGTPTSRMAVLTSAVGHVTR